MSKQFVKLSNCSIFGSQVVIALWLLSVIGSFVSLFTLAYIGTCSYLLGSSTGFCILLIICNATSLFSLFYWSVYQPPKWFLLFGCFIKISITWFSFSVETSFLPVGLLLRNMWWVSCFILLFFVSGIRVHEICLFTCPVKFMQSISISLKMCETFVGLFKVIVVCNMFMSLIFYMHEKPLMVSTMESMFVLHISISKQPKGFSFPLCLASGLLVDANCFCCKWFLLSFFGEWLNECNVWHNTLYNEPDPCMPPSLQKSQSSYELYSVRHW